MKEKSKYILGVLLYIVFTLISIILVKEVDLTINHVVDEQLNENLKITTILTKNTNLYSYHKPLFEEKSYNNNNYLKTMNNCSDAKTGDIVNLNIKNMYKDEITEYECKYKEKIEFNIKGNIDKHLKENYYIINTYFDYITFIKDSNLEPTYDREFFLSKKILILKNNKNIISIYANEDSYEIRTNNISDSKDFKIIELNTEKYVDKIKFINADNRKNYYKKYEKMKELKLHILENNLYTFTYDDDELVYNTYYAITLKEVNEIVETNFENKAIEVVSKLNLTEKEIEEIKKNIGVEDNEEEN